MPDTEFTRTDLWTFATQLYADPPVQVHALTLQDREGVDISFLLFAVWCGMERGLTLTPAELARMEARIQPWRQQVIAPLRALRRALKTQRLQSLDSEKEAIRHAIKQLEQRAERVQLQALESLAAELACGTPAPRGTASALANLRSVLTQQAPACGERADASLQLFRSALQAMRVQGEPGPA